MMFWIGAAVCSIRLHSTESLKERRHVVRSLTDGARSRFNVSCADLGPHLTRQGADVGFTAAGSSAEELDERLANLENFLRMRETGGEFEIVDYSREVFAYGDLSD